MGEVRRSVFILKKGYQSQKISVSSMDTLSILDNTEYAEGHVRGRGERRLPAYNTSKRASIKMIEELHGDLGQRDAS